jgi:DNA ligase-1
MKDFKPFLAPNDQLKPEEMIYPLLASIKLDGVRVLFYKGKILTRSLKSVPNKQLNEKFEPIRKFSEENNVILDGEVFAPGIPFQFIVSCFMTEDYNDKKSMKKWDELCKEHNFFMSREEVFNNLKFYCFDCIEFDNPNIHFQYRQKQAELIMMRFPGISFPLEHVVVDSAKEVEDYFKKVLDDGYEGLILRNPKGKYKYGRATLNLT